MALGVLLGDITKLAVDCIVNAANETLLGGGGVDGAIHRAAGPLLYDECKALRGCRPGEAKLTRGYRLPARWIIHTVGPVWYGGGDGEDETLDACYRNSMRLAARRRFKSLAFPAISTGIYGFPLERACAIAAAAVREEMAAAGRAVDVTFVCFDPETEEATSAALGL